MFVKCVNPHSASLGPLCADWTIPIYTFSANAYSVYLPKILSAIYQVLYRYYFSSMPIPSALHNIANHAPLFLGIVTTIVDIRSSGDHWLDRDPVWVMMIYKLVDLIKMEIQIH